MVSSIKFPDRYQFIGPKMEGGFGDVYVCLDTVLNRTVAIKVIKKWMDVKRHLDEINALQSIRSRHVVEIYDVLEDADGDNIGIIEEYLPGEQLDSYPKPSHTPIEVLKTLYQIVSGINDIHKHDIIHRDIKPHSMRFDAEGLIKIFDFNLSRPDGANARTVGFAGTQGFAAPEQYVSVGEEARFGKPADVYAFAATSYYLIDGVLPAPLRELPPLHLSAPPSFANARSRLPLEVINILDRCLAKSPFQRPDIAEVHSVLSRYLLQGKHRALMTLNGQVHRIQNGSPGVGIRHSINGVAHNADIYYDGLYFRIRNIQGLVYINARQVAENSVIPGSCVIALGHQTDGAARSFVTIDLSHPEVVL